MSDMIAHHGQALVMAGWAPSHGASPPVRTLAERIVSGQEDEIALMQRWLRDRQQPVGEPSGGGGQGAADTSTHSPSQDHAHAGHDMAMPGMLTQAQLAQLDRARGSEFDRLFLELMIQHHEGALTMVKELMATPGAAQDSSVFQFVADVAPG